MGLGDDLMITSFARKIKEKYPNLTFELDHPLSKSSLNNSSVA